MTFNPLAFDASAFLWLYSLDFVASLGLSWFAAHRLRPAGRAQPVDDPDSLALLAGGTDRLTETAIARLLASGVFTADGKAFNAAAAPVLAPAGSLDRAMAALPAPARWADLRRVASDEAARLRLSLESAGLLFDAATASQLRIVQVLPFAALLVLGMARLVRGVMLGNPVGYLAVMLAVTLVIGLSRIHVDRRTRAGITAVRLARDTARRLRLAPTRSEMPLAVAVFGTVVLAGSELEPLHRLRSGGGDGGGVDASSGDGGCGGGGCGGCGG